MRVYCGLAATEAVARSTGDEAWLTAAVVDDAGRLLDVCDVSDEAIGYAELAALLAERSGGAGGVPVAADNDEYEITLLLAAAGAPLAIADEEMMVDYAERFADEESAEELAADPNVRHAIGLARALQAGALAASGQGAPRELMALKPVLAAHTAMTASRHSSAVALREVLRELYPAALRAYPDPADPIPLAILDALPEPSLLGVTNRGRDAAVAAELAMAGVSDPTTIAEAITSLRVAASETPRRTGIGKGTTAVVAETIRQAVAAVRACDAAAAALIGLVATKSPAPRAGHPARLRSVGPRAIEAARPTSGRAGDPYAGRSEPAWTGPTRNDKVRPESARTEAARASRRATRGNPAAPVAGSRPAVVPPPAAVAPPAEAPARPNRTPLQRSARGKGRAAQNRNDEYPADAAALAPIDNPVQPQYVPADVPEGYGYEPSTGYPANGNGYASGYGAGDGYGNGNGNGYDNGNGYSDGYSNGNGYAGDPAGNGYAPMPAGYPITGLPAQGSRESWPLNRPDPADDMAHTSPYESPRFDAGWPDTSMPAEPDYGDTSIPRQRDGRVAPPWQTDDLALPAQPAVLGLPSTDPPVLRLVGPDDLMAPSTRTTSLDEPLPPAPAYGNEPDEDLLIFAETRSAWFVGPQFDGDDSPTWSDAGDLGWSAAQRAAHPTTDGETDVGLPRRVPKANLVPGAPLPPSADSPHRPVRDAAAMAAHTTGYFRGSRRGEEVRGYAVGGRPGRESGDGWDFSRDGWDSDREPEYRSAAQW
ncbi:MAG TPA: transposase [Micromonosporaceae bacterium]|nr:transposase [Micromonosporaceae bacterium]